MNISGMRPYEGFYEYNSIKAVALRSQQIAAVQNASGDEELSGGSQPQGQTQTKRPQTYNAFDYAKEYQPDETYELKGADSDLAGLDMQKAISDMEKDQVLQQYQYFMGTQDKGGARRTEARPQGGRRLHRRERRAHRRLPRPGFLLCVPERIFPFST